MTVVEFSPVNAHKFQREKHEHYVEPFWCSERLFEAETFKDSVWDPCCGFGRIPEAANRAGLIGLGTDVVNRGWIGQKTTLDFFKVAAPLSENIVGNPPFNVAGAFMRHAIDLPGVEKVAMIFPTARLNAAHWIAGTPLARVWLMTPRPSMPPGHTIAAGEKPQGGKMDFAWLVFTKGHIGQPSLRWLRREAA